MILYSREIKSREQLHKGLRHKSAMGRLQAVKTEAEKAWGSEVSSLLFALSAKPKREMGF